MRTAAAYFLFLFLFFPIHEAGAEITRLCNIEIDAAEPVEFTDTERKWLCGDPESQAWKTIPVSQQKFFLESFLQSKAYHRPEFTEESGILKVSAGRPLEVQKFTVTGAPPEWNWAKRWGVKGEPLTPGTLDTEAAWARRQLLERGYPCPEVSSQAFVDTGEIRIHVDPGEDFQFAAIETAGTADLDPAIIERFNAFVPGQRFDIRLLELTSARILREDLYLSSYFDLICKKEEGVKILRRSVPAEPRIFTIGAGFDTEQGPLARARFKWARLGSAAHSLEASLFASFREQSLSSRFEYFFLEDLSSRLRFVPSLSVERLVEENFIAVTSRMGAQLANSWEFENFQLYAEAGPVLERVNQRRGEGPKRVDTVKLTTRTSATSHMFEYYLTDPRTGRLAILDTSTQFAGVLSQENIHRVSLQHQILWNLGRFDPPILILGWRGLLGSFFFSDRSEALPEVAVSHRFFLGGNDSIRGFSRKELPGSGEGFFTVLYQGLELRTGGWLPLNLQPFVFFDWAKGGTRAHNLDDTNYFAPGFGLRYESPIGTVRVSLGRGLVGNRDETDPLPHWQFFFSFGREF